MPDEKPLAPEQVADELGITDETPDLDEATFDLEAWIGGIESTVRAVPIRQRADLIGDIESLDYWCKILDQVPEQERSLVEDEGEPLPKPLAELVERLDLPDGRLSTLRQALLERAELFERTTVIFRVQGRSDEWRNAGEKRLKKAGVGKDDIQLHLLAESIIEPKGVTPALLRKLGEMSEPQLKMLLVAWTLANVQPPDVNAPLSRGSSDKRSAKA